MAGSTLFPSNKTILSKKKCNSRSKVFGSCFLATMLREGFLCVRDIVLCAIMLYRRSILWGGYDE